MSSDEHMTEELMGLVRKNIRIPRQLYELLVLEAKHNFRRLNEEIIFQLEMMMRLKPYINGDVEQFQKLLMLLNQDGFSLPIEGKIGGYEKAKE